MLRISVGDSRQNCSEQTHDNAKKSVLNTDPESGSDDRSWDSLGCDFPFGIYCCKLQSKALSASNILTQCHSWIIDAAIQGLGWLFFTPSWPRRSGKGLREGGSFLWNATRTKEVNPRCALAPWNCRTEFALCFKPLPPWLMHAKLYVCILARGAEQVLSARAKLILRGMEKLWPNITWSMLFLGRNIVTDVSWMDGTEISGEV